MKISAFRTALTSVAAVVLGCMALPAAATVDLGAGTLNGLTSIGGCTNSILTPEADQCFGVVAGNNLGNATPGRTAVENFIAQTWSSVDVSTSFTVNSPVDADSSAAGFQLDLGGTYLGDFVIALKQATGFSLYFFDDIAIATQFITFFDNDGFGGKGNLGISHFTLYGGQLTAVPLPGTLVLLGLGLAGLGFSRRRKTS